MAPYRYTNSGRTLDLAKFTSFSLLALLLKSTEIFFCFITLKREHYVYCCYVCIFSVDDDDGNDDDDTAAAVVAVLFLLDRDAELNMRLTGGKQKLDYLLASIADYSAPLVLFITLFYCMNLIWLKEGFENFSNLSAVRQRARRV